MDVSQRKAFLKYMGRRRWRRVKRASNATDKNFLVYLGKRRWKKVKD